MADLILAIDEGTTSTRAIVFDMGGREVAVRSRDIAQTAPEPGWVEQDPDAIWEATRACAEAVAADVGPGRIAAIGITNQRETVVFWDRVSGEALGSAIVWQDRRGAAMCGRLAAEGREPGVQARTGLVLDSYFSGSKIAWAFEHRPEIARAADAGRLAIGTVDSWLMWKLTGGAVHLTDATNASRTLLMDLGACAWAPEMLALFGAPPGALPAITDCVGALGEAVLAGRRVPVTGMAGDQQAALVGHGCLGVGEAKATFGTGAFLLANCGAAVPVSRHRLLATVGYRLGGRATYALEGSIFIAGEAARWLKHGIGFLPADADLGAMAASVPDSGGVSFVPALVGLGAPWWRPDARGAILGLSNATSPAHIARACLEAVAQQTADLVDALAADGVQVETLSIGGGMAANDWLAQELADALGIVIERPRATETTALGAAMLAAVGAGLFGSLGEAVAAMGGRKRRFEPKRGVDRRAADRARWATAVAQVLAGTEGGYGALPPAVFCCPVSAPVRHARESWGLEPREPRFVGGALDPSFRWGDENGGRADGP